MNPRHERAEFRRSLSPRMTDAERAEILCDLPRWQRQELNRSWQKPIFVAIFEDAVGLATLAQLRCLFKKPTGRAFIGNGGRFRRIK